ncbi:hypothetical protein [Roseiflexus castenholzii]|uniref:Uncharacterized protein n=1 Tax=Roseiflexus castenholzii (strain DSM 13941 / HLO8) TaxID=383372 RepID=A7NPC3_ROSCS|nr:hypothetical protein [Roseiflexus castenholzii]ABU59419.1 conserved hypothetical protein [Roseiflexus castenholzii DSM 13941]
MALAGCGQPLQLDAVQRTRTPLVAQSAVSTGMPDRTASTSAPTRVTQTAAQERSPTAAPATRTPTVQIIPSTPMPQTSDARWRAQQIDREVLDPPQVYRVVRRTPLFWFDPMTGQTLEIGTVLGNIPVQARFRLRATGEVALEVPYRINNDFGLTAISEAVRSRMEAAGYTVSVEAFVLESDAIQAP